MTAARCSPPIPAVDRLNVLQHETKRLDLHSITCARVMRAHFLSSRAAKIMPCWMPRAPAPAPCAGRRMRAGRNPPRQIPRNGRAAARTTGSRRARGETGGAAALLHLLAGSRRRMKKWSALSSPIIRSGACAGRRRNTPACRTMRAIPPAMCACCRSAMARMASSPRKWLSLPQPWDNEFM